MSKSLGNFILTKDLITHHNPMDIRFFMLSVHYRNPINFTEELLKEAKRSFNRIKIAHANLGHRKNVSTDLTMDDDKWIEEIYSYTQQFEEAMDDDFNTAKAISVLFDMTKRANTYLDFKQTSTSVIQRFQN